MEKGNLLLQLKRLDYNHLYVFGKSVHQEEHRVLKKGFEEGLSMRQISNLFVYNNNIYIYIYSAIIIKLILQGGSNVARAIPKLPTKQKENTTAS